MFKEYDVVCAKVDISKTVKSGCIGTILICYERGAYEVEFFDEHYNHLDLITVTEEQIEVRPLHQSM